MTGGTRGLGRAIGLAFARTGARVVLTHRWGSVDARELQASFAAEGAALPEVVEADVASPEDTRALLDHIGHGGVDVFVSNVTVVGRSNGRISQRDLRRSLEYSAWPLLRYIDAIAERFEGPPRYVVAMSSDGPDRFYPGYDYVAASKAVVESLCRRMALRHPETRMNVLRARQVDTAGYREIFGEEARAVMARFAHFEVEPEEVARVAVSLCSGDLDGLSSEIVMVDRGAGPIDSLINVAPTLMKDIAFGQPEPPAQPGARRRAGVLWVDAGVRPGKVEFSQPLEIVSEDAVASLDPDRIPDSVVVGCDWRNHEEEDAACASLLTELMDRARENGGAPRRGVRVDRAVDPPMPGEALARVLEGYWVCWHVQEEARLNAVRYTRDEHHTSAIAAVRALLSDAFDGVRGQVLRVTRELRS